MLLKIEDDALNKIAQDNGSKIGMCCNAMLKEWLHKNVTASWDDMFRVIDIIRITTQLQTFYKHEKGKDMEDDWESYQPEHFADVSIIYHKEKDVSQQQMEGVAKSAHKAKISVGSFEQSSDSANNYIATCKRTKNVSDIFDPIITQNAILIEGAPGIGKTVFSREIAFQWGSENLLCDKLFLFLIHLRDPQIPEIKTLNQFVCYVIKSCPESKLVKLTKECLDETLGKCCTIVLDGYDELSEKVKKDSFITTIIKRRILPHCSLVITSHPSASADLRRNVDCRVEILGFTKADRNEYIHKNLQGEEIKKSKNT